MTKTITTVHTDELMCALFDLGDKNYDRSEVSNIRFTSHVGEDGVHRSEMLISGKDEIITAFVNGLDFECQIS